MDFGGEAPADWMARDVVAEEGAIVQYEKHRDAIDDPRIKAMIDRIITDERAHLVEFSKLQAEFAEAGRVAMVSPNRPAGESIPEASVVDYATRHEYTVLLQYLFHSFMTTGDEASREWETIAINEMQHLGWFSEYAADEGMQPLMTHDPIEKGHLTSDMLDADIAAEEAVSRRYSDAIAEYTPDADKGKLVRVLTRARDNEDWHAHMFRLMRDRVAAGDDPVQRPGIGPTQPPERRDAAAGAASRPEAPADPGGDAGTTGGSKGLTVGSLIE